MAAAYVSLPLLLVWAICAALPARGLAPGTAAR
jgi:hypothetical protein